MAYMSAVKAGDSSTAYIPDTLFVLYPQLIDGKEIYEEYGGLKGIQIGIDVKSLRVSDVSGIEKIALEAASYTLE